MSQIRQLQLAALQSDGRCYSVAVTDSATACILLYISSTKLQEYH